MSPIERNNNFGALRLLFASLVAVAHSPELVDGDRSRELLTRVFGTLSFGELAVDGFFFISGYLIAQSFTSADSIGDFMRKRFLRIYPAYAVCFAICVAVVAPIAGGHDFFAAATVKRLLTQILLLREPKIPGTFEGMDWRYLNLPMWTLSLEFKCYLGTAAFGLCGMLRRERRLWIAAVLGLLIVTYAASGCAAEQCTVPGIAKQLRFPMIYGAGTAAFLFRDRIPLRAGLAALAALLLAASLSVRALSEVGVALFGGYLILWFAFAARPIPAPSFARRADLSYGIYLYAYPVQALTVWFHRTIDPWLLTAIALTAATALAFASWRLIEAPALARAARPLCPALWRKLGLAGRGRLRRR